MNTETNSRTLASWGLLTSGFRVGYIWLSRSWSTPNLHAKFSGGTATSVTNLIDPHPFVKPGIGFFVLYQSNAPVRTGELPSRLGPLTLQPIFEWRLVCNRVMPQAPADQCLNWIPPEAKTLVSSFIFLASQFIGANVVKAQLWHPKKCGLSWCVRGRTVDLSPLPSVCTLVNFTHIVV